MGRARSLVLFVRTGDPGCERVVAFVEDAGIADLVRIKDVADAGASATAESRGASALPALWDGATLFTGTEVVLARLRAFLDVGRAD